MLRLDVGTLAFSAAIASFAAALVIAAYGSPRRHDKHWGLFALSAAGYGLAAFPVVLIHSIPVTPIIPGVNPLSLLAALTILAALAFHAGTCHLADRPRSTALYLAVIVAYCAGEASFHGTEVSINARIALISLVRVPIFLHAALLIRASARDRSSAGTRLLSGVAWGWAALLTVRGVDALVAESPIRDLVGMSGAQAVYFLATGLANVLLAVGLLRRDTDTATTRLANEAADNRTRSEADLRAILDNMTDVFYRTDADGLLLIVSRSAEMVLGYAAAEMVGTRVADYFADDAERNALLNAMQAGGGSITDYEFRMRHKDGQAVWVSISGRFRFDAQGRQDGTEGIARLIEGRKRAEMRAQESQAMIRALLDASTDSIMLIEADGTLLAVNDVMARRFGRTADALAGTGLWDLFPSEVAAGRRAACMAVLASGVPVHTLDRRDDLFLDNSIYPVTGADGRPYRLAVYSRDITVQKLAEAKIEDYVAEVERSNAELEQFAYVASHDLREPLRMISSYLSLLERRYGPQLDDSGIEFLAYARDGALRMDRLVLDLLDFSRIERRGSPIVAMPALPAIEIAIRHLDPAIVESGARVSVDIAEPTPTVMGDADQIARLFQNLIGNAIKYRADDRQSEIRISYTRVGGAWEFRVTDNGIGIDPVYFEKIFRIFQRLHTRDKFEGTGIGLAICKKIVERHDGRIWLDSVPGEGSTFVFTLKAAP